MTDDKNTGFGTVSPLDTDEKAGISITVENGLVSSAEYDCSPDTYIKQCAEALCGVITGMPALDLFQMNANAVYYNLEKELPRNKLYCASMAVTAAKRAAADWCRKNGIDVPHPENGCSCY